ncbi:MAG TPA: hypothetical protein VIB82_06895 [Caulobacteraceae bacterium]|jgi:hypothetical protein
MAKPSDRDERPAAPGPAGKGDAAREARLAAALRVNLRRRKSASRLAGAARNQSPADGESDQ